jgi:hypothetical protein
MMVLGNSVLGNGVTLVQTVIIRTQKTTHEEVKLWSYETEVLLKLVCSFVD